MPTMTGSRTDPWRESNHSRAESSHMKGPRGHVSYNMSGGMFGNDA